MVIGIILNFVLSLWIIPQYVGAKRKIGFWWSLVACVFLTPFVGGIITFLSPKLEEYKTENIKKVKEENRVRTEQDKKLDNLKSLKDDGILTESEYQNKVEILEKEKAVLEEKSLFEELKKQDSYKKLKSLFDNGVLTKEEFDMKVKKLIEQFKASKIEPVISLTKQDLVGKWFDNFTRIYFYKNGQFILSNVNDLTKPIKGNYLFKDNKIFIKYDKSETYKELVVNKISDNKLNYYQDKREYNLIKGEIDINIEDFQKLLDKHKKKHLNEFYIKPIATILAILVLIALILHFNLK